jgi:hypothetical protein
MIDPRTPKGRQVAKLFHRATQDVRYENALPKIRRAQQLHGTERTIAWARVGSILRGAVSEQNWPRIWPALRRRCDESGLAYPFTAEDEQVITERINSER